MYIIASFIFIYTTCSDALWHCSLKTAVDFHCTLIKHSMDIFLKTSAQFLEIRTCHVKTHWPS